MEMYGEVGVEARLGLRFKLRSRFSAPLFCALRRWLKKLAHAQAESM